MHLIPEAHLISCTLKLITSIVDFTGKTPLSTKQNKSKTYTTQQKYKHFTHTTLESFLRQKNLLKVFDLLVKKDLAAEGVIFAMLFKDPWLMSVWTTYVNSRRGGRVAGEYIYKK